MADIQVELNREGVRELLRSPGMGGICRGHALAIAKRAGTGYSVSVYTGPNRVNASVMTETVEAARENLESNTLLKAVK